MNRIITLVIFTILIFISCQPQRYSVASMKGEIIEMNNSYDQNPNKELKELVDQHKDVLDKLMGEKVGESASLMTYGYPESPLTNFTSDAMKAYGDKQLKDGADVAVMNVHGHRATMPKGVITLGNLYEIYSFDNTIVFLKLKGKDLNRIFNSYARMGGSGISSNVKLIIKDKKVKSVRINGQPVDENKVYNIVTLDYLADGNNGMDAFLDAVEINNTGITLRDMMIKYVKEQTNDGKVLSSKNDGRIIIEQ